MPLGLCPPNQVTDITADSLEDIGYAQYAGSYVTTMLFKLPGVANIQRWGYWKFAPDNYMQGQCG